MEDLLSGRSVVVTGASHGLGLSIATELATSGADVVLVARDKARLREVAEGLQGMATGRIAAHACDVSDATQVEELAATVLETMGGVDTLINNAGIPAPRSFQETSFNDWNRVIAVNLSGPFNMARAFWEALVASGRGYVINISGTAGRRGGTSPAYSSAKFGLTGLTRAIAASGKPYNLRATVLYPGAMDTGWRGTPIGEKPRAETMDPSEVARYVGYLLATPAEFVINESVLNPLADPFL